MLSKSVAAACFALAWSMAGAGDAQTSDKPQFGAWGLDLSAMDKQVLPGNDFNRYASGAWLARTQIPADKPMASLRYLMTDRTEARLHELMDKGAATASQEPRDLEGKVGAFYKAFMDEARVDKLGAEPIAAELAAIRGASGRDDITELMGRNNSDFFATIFTLGTDVDLKDVKRYALYATQAGLGLPDRDYYLQPSFAKQKAAYQAYVAELLELIGWPASQASAAGVVDFETKIAAASWTKTEQRDVDKIYNPIQTPDLAALTPGFAWSRFLTGAGLGNLDRVIVAEKSAFVRIGAVYQSAPLDVLKAWQAFSVADNAAFYLSKPFSTARSGFRDKILSGQLVEPVRWKRAIHAVSGEDCTGDRVDCFGNLGFGVGQLYTARYFPPAAKAKIEALVANVKAAMRARLERLDWMTPATKAEALKKLDTYQIKVGYPDHPRDYSAVLIRSDDLLGDVRRAAEADWHFYLSRLNGPVDRTDWSMTPQTNDAYNGSLRDIVFPAGILQPPIFDAAADPAINYGAIGGVIGHELTHGFDDEGAKFDAQGNLKNWWTPEDLKNFKARGDCIEKQFDSFEVEPGLHENGKLVEGESIADLGGLTIAHAAFEKSLEGKPTPPAIDGFTPDQRFFLAFAQIWAGSFRPEYGRMIVATNPHPLNNFRANGPVSNMPSFAKAWGCKADSPMVRPEVLRCRIW